MCFVIWWKKQLRKKTICYEIIQNMFARSCIVKCHAHEPCLGSVLRNRVYHLKILNTDLTSSAVTVIFQCLIPVYENIVNGLSEPSSSKNIKLQHRSFSISHLSPFALRNRKHMIMKLLFQYRSNCLISEKPHKDEKKCCPFFWKR